MWRSCFVFGTDESQRSKTASNQSILSRSRFQKVRFFFIFLFSCWNRHMTYAMRETTCTSLCVCLILLQQLVTHWGFPSVWGFRNSRKFQGMQNSKLIPPEFLSQVLNDSNNIHSGQNLSYIWGRTVTIGYPIHLYLKSEGYSSNCRHKHRFGSRY